MQNNRDTRKIWKEKRKGNLKKLEHLFGYTITPQKGKATNSDVFCRRRSHQSTKKHIEYNSQNLGQR